MSIQDLKSYSPTVVYTSGGDECYADMTEPPCWHDGMYFSRADVEKVFASIKNLEEVRSILRTGMIRAINATNGSASENCTSRFLSCGGDEVVSYIEGLKSRISTLESDIEMLKIQLTK